MVCSIAAAVKCVAIQCNLEYIIFLHTYLPRINNCLQSFPSGDLVKGGLAIIVSAFASLCIFSSPDAVSLHASHP